MNFGELFVAVANTFSIFFFLFCFVFFCNVSFSSSSVVLFADDNEHGDFLSLILYLG